MLILKIVLWMVMVMLDDGDVILDVDPALDYETLGDDG